MRFAQIGDTHLGYRALRYSEGGENIRTKDTRRAFARACAEIAAEMEYLDFVLHTGDLFDMAKPNYRTIAQAIAGLSKIAEAGKPVILVAGNHDTPRVKTAGSVYDIMREALPANVHIVSGYEVETIDLTITTKYGPEDVRFLCVPYGALMMGNLNQEPTDGPENWILVAHGTLAGAMPELEAVAGYDFSIEDVLPGWAPGFMHVALGHLHTLGIVEERVLYNGSTNRFGWSDKTAEPGWWTVTADRDTWQAEHHALPSRAMFQMETLSIDYKAGEDTEEARIRIASTIEREVMYHTTSTLNKGGELPLLKVEIVCNRADYRAIANSLMGMMDGRSLWNLTIDRSTENDVVLNFPSFESGGGMTIRGLLQSYQENVLVDRYGNVESERIGKRMLEYLDRAEEEQA